MRIVGEEFDDLVARRIQEWQLTQRRRGEMPASTQEAMRRVVTLSRELGSGGSDTARHLHEATGWEIWDRRIVEEIARSAQVRMRMVESVDERAYSEIVAMVDELLGERMEQAGYRRHLAEVVLTIARLGDAIIIGRGTNWLLPDALNVRIIAPMKQRVERVALREGISESEAERLCRRSDRERAEFVRALFDKAIDDLTGYDLVINTQHLDPAAAAAVILTAVPERFG
ncbi:MAG TPA: cytidylate kinase-like family protein [Armatimonadetes bacterium]|jgi:cytidylate kinase|nr:cytidylate kinase-like family protein [Armatimonadota bacterium]